MLNLPTLHMQIVPRRGDRRIGPFPPFNWESTTREMHEVRRNNKFTSQIQNLHATVMIDSSRSISILQNCVREAVLTLVQSLGLKNLTI